eukprot:3383676-Rhodomonas_salina.2
MRRVVRERLERVRGAGCHGGAPGSASGRATAAGGVPGACPSRCGLEASLRAAQAFSAYTSMLRGRMSGAGAHWQRGREGLRVDSKSLVGRFVPGYDSIASVPYNANAYKLYW